MATRIRNETWKNDDALKNAFIKYIRQGLQRKEILDFVQRDFSKYAWSLRTLDRSIKYFEIPKFDYRVTVDQVQRKVAEEGNGPGQLLGYRAPHQKSANVKGMNVCICMCVCMRGMCMCVCVCVCVWRGTGLNQLFSLIRRHMTFYSP